MFCKHCGLQIADDSKFCSNCGLKVEEDTSAATVDDEEKEIDAEENICEKELYTAEDMLVQEKTFKTHIAL